MNRQSKGLATALWCFSKAMTAVAASLRSSKSSGTRALRRKGGEVDLAQPGGVDGQADHLRVRVGVGQSCRRGPVAVRGPVVHDPGHAFRRRAGLGGHDLVDERGERPDPRGFLAAAHDLGPVDVVGGEVGDGAVAAEHGLRPIVVREKFLLMLPHEQDDTVPVRPVQHVRCAAPPGVPERSPRLVCPDNGRPARVPDGFRNGHRRPG